VQCNQGTTPSWEPHFGRAGQVPKIDPRRATRLVERTAVGKGERGWVSKGSRVGDSSPGSREAEGEGGEGFYIAQSGKRADLLVSPGGDLGGLRARL
jgi:hypothetical protein